MTLEWLFADSVLLLLTNVRGTNIPGSQTRDVQHEGELDVDESWRALRECQVRNIPRKRKSQFNVQECISSARHVRRLLTHHWQGLVYVYVYERTGTMFTSDPAEEEFSWIRCCIGFVVTDFCYYWVHRLKHGESTLIFSRYIRVIPLPNPSSYLPNALNW